MLINGNNPKLARTKRRAFIEGNIIEDNNPMREYGNEVYHIWKHYLDKKTYFQNAGVFRHNTIRLENPEQSYSADPLLFNADNHVYDEDGGEVFGGTSTLAMLSAMKLPDASFHYNGNWHVASLNSGKTVLEDQEGAEYHTDFSGRQAAVSGSTGPDRGIVKIIVDG